VKTRTSPAAARPRAAENRDEMTPFQLIGSVSKGAIRFRWLNKEMPRSYIL